MRGNIKIWGGENPRYFATHEEFAEWFEKVGFRFDVADTFESTIKLQKASEMSESGKMQFSEFMSGLPGDTKKTIGLQIDDEGGYTYQLPGVIYKLMK